MIEASASGTFADQTAFAVAAKPRVSASSFRDLTARLRKAEIPSLTPVAIQAPVAAPTFAPAPTPAAVVVPDILPEPAPAESWQLDDDLDPYIPPPKKPAEVSAPSLTEFAPADTSGFAPSNLPEFAPASPAGFAPPSLPEFSPPPAPVAPEPVVEQVAIEVEAPVEVPPVAPDEAELVVKEDTANQALKDMAKNRQHQLELETIWRMLLATPSAEERVVYLREAAEIMGTDLPELPPAAPEFDLSVIAPADFVPEPEPAEILSAESTPELPVILAEPEDPTAIDSAELARSLLDMMASGANSGLPQERALAADTLLRLVPRLDVKSLVMLAQRVARMDDSPVLIVAKLLRDQRVEVSGPLLEDCPQISDRDLESVIAENDMARMRMIARRRRLNHTITDALVANGDVSVMLTLVRNAEAEISQEGYLKLIAAAGSNIDLLAPLCTRADMSAPMAFELFWHAPAQLRRFILTRFLTDSETLTKILRITMSTNELDQLSEQEGSMQHTVVEALERAARGKLDVAASDLAGALKVDRKTVSRILKDPQGEPLVVMLKVAGYPRQALAGLINRYRDPEIGLVDAAREAEELVSIFETLSFNKARILLTYWDWAQRRTGPYAPIN